MQVPAIVGSDPASPTPRKSPLSNNIIGKTDGRHAKNA
jgi:hypothetical protein